MPEWSDRSVANRVNRFFSVHAEYRFRVPAQPGNPAPAAYRLAHNHSGGLSHENVAGELSRINGVVGDATIWIDAEKLLR
jgi:hypothetical protein